MQVRRGLGGLGGKFLLTHRYLLLNNLPRRYQLRGPRMLSLKYSIERAKVSPLKKFPSPMSTMVCAATANRRVVSDSSRGDDISQVSSLNKASNSKEKRYTIA